MSRSASTFDASENRELQALGLGPGNRLQRAHSAVFIDSFYSPHQRQPRFIGNQTVDEIEDASSSDVTRIPRVAKSPCHLLEAEGPSNEASPRFDGIALGAEVCREPSAHGKVAATLSPLPEESHARSQHCSGPEQRRRCRTKRLLPEPSGRCWLIAACLSTHSSTPFPLH